MDAAWQFVETFSGIVVHPSWIKCCHCVPLFVDMGINITSLCQCLTLACWTNGPAPTHEHMYTQKNAVLVRYVSRTPVFRFFFFFLETQVVKNIINWGEWISLALMSGRVAFATITLPYQLPRPLKPLCVGEGETYDTVSMLVVCDWLLCGTVVCPSLCGHQIKL